jgi:uncharacterized protein (TIGR02265 family)
MGAFSTDGAAGPRASAARVKGTLVVTLMKFLRSHGLPPEDVLARLTASDRDRLQGILLPSGWYPAESVARFMEAAVAAVAKGSKAECLVKMGHFSARTNLGPDGLRRAYIREDDPHHVLAAIARIYQTVYSVGRRSYERTGERSAIIRGHGTRAAYDHCKWVTGWLQGVVELSGGKDVRVVESRCEGSGSPHCEFLVEWK